MKHQNFCNSNTCGGGVHKAPFFSTRLRSKLLGRHNKNPWVGPQTELKRTLSFSHIHYFSYPLYLIFSISHIHHISYSQPQRAPYWHLFLTLTKVIGSCLSLWWMHYGEWNLVNQSENSVKQTKTKTNNQKTPEPCHPIVSFSNNNFYNFQCLIWSDCLPLPLNFLCWSLDSDVRY